MSPLDMVELLLCSLSQILQLLCILNELVEWPSLCLLPLCGEFLQ